MKPRQKIVAWLRHLNLLDNGILLQSGRFSGYLRNNPLGVMKNKSIFLLLLSALLLSQTAIARHDIEHKAFEHTDLCAVFVTADQTADCDIPLVELVFPLALETQFVIAPTGLVAPKLSAYLSRAPPLA